MAKNKNPAWLKGRKVVILADWLTTYGGAEKVVKTVSEIFPQAQIITSQYSEKEVDWFKGKNVKAGWLNILPAKLRKILGVGRAMYFSGLDLSDFDVVISISTAESKGVKTANNQLHISYLQGPPIQYYWGMFDDYVKNPGFGKFNPIVRFFFKLLVKPLRRLDYKFAQRPDFLLANSTYCKEEIAKYYGRSSEVVFPPVETEKFKPASQKSDYFITTSRQVNWKRLDLAVEAFKKSGEKLILVGDGAEHDKLLALADGAKNIEFIPTIKNPKELAKLVAAARGFVFPSLEPFGIAPIEALASGVPVVAFKKGGALDYIIDGKNGVFFDAQNVESLGQALAKFDKMKLKPAEISRSAQNFSVEDFKCNFEQFIKEKFDEKFE